MRWVLALFAAATAVLMAAVGVATMVAALLGAFSEELTREAVVVWGLAELAIASALAVGSALAFLGVRNPGVHLVFACIATAGAALPYLDVAGEAGYGYALNVAFGLLALRSWLICLLWIWAAFSRLKRGGIESGLKHARAGGINLLFSLSDGNGD